MIFTWCLTTLKAFFRCIISFYPHGSPVRKVYTMNNKNKFICLGKQCVYCGKLEPIDTQRKRVKITLKAITVNIFIVASQSFRCIFLNFSIKEWDHIV